MGPSLPKRSAWVHRIRRFRLSLVRTGNAEFRENVAKAFRQKSPVRLVVATAQNSEHVEAGKDASKVKKDFAVREDLMGEVAAYDGDKFVFRFVRSSA